MNRLKGLYSFAVLSCLLGCGRDGDGEFKEYVPTPARSTTSADSTPLTVPIAPSSTHVPAVAESSDDGKGGTIQTSAAEGDLIEFGGRKFRWEPLPPAVAEKPVREIKLLVPHQTFQTVGPEGAVRVSYDDIDLLRVLNMEPVPVDCVEHFPDWLKQLDGRRIRLRGFMFPPFEAENLRGFVLARDNDICCFGRDPKRYDVIDVFMRKGATTDYIAGRPFDVVGVFHIEPEAIRGQLVQLYVIDDAIVIAK